MNEFVTYCLYSKKYNKIYIGYTSGLIERVRSHNIFATKGHTLKFRPWIVVYVEFHESKCEAMKREKQLKTGKKRIDSALAWLAN